MSEVFKKKGAIFQSNNSNYFKWFLFKRITVYNLLFLFVFIGFKYLNIFQEIFLCTFLSLCFNTFFKYGNTNKNYS